MPKDSKIGTDKCPKRTPSGSYYAPNFWCGCKKQNFSEILKEWDMCDLDAGRECRFAESPVQIKGKEEKA